MDTDIDTVTDQGAARSDGSDTTDDADFVYDVDGVTYHYGRPLITGSAIMVAARVPATDGLVQLLSDGTAVTVKPEEEVHLVPGTQFKRRPRFKRG